MTRDMTEAQFREACKRRGFRPVLCWLEDVKMAEAGRAGVMYGMVLRGDGNGGINRRASLARALQERAKDMKKSA